MRTPAALFLASLLPFILWLGARPIWSLDEARPALVATEMVRTGHWAIPRIGGRVYPDKPPLFMWVVALLSPRGITEWTLRLPSAIATAATVAATYLIGARLAGRGAGLVAAGVLASSFGVFQWARTGRMEALLVLWITLGVWSLTRWLDEGRRRDALAFGLWAGLAVLTKGPLVLILLLVALAALLVSSGQRTAALRPGALALGTGLGIVLSWIGVAALFSPDFGDYVRNLRPAIEEEIRTRPQRHPLYAASIVGAGFLPWAFLLPATLAVLVREGRDAWRSVRVPVLWAGVVFVVFAVVFWAREAHLLPIYPALALLVGWAWNRARGALRWWVVGPMIVLVSGLAIGVAAAILSGQAIVRHDVRIPVAGWPAGLVVCMALVTAIALYVLTRRGRPVAAALALAAAALGLLLLIEVSIAVPATNRAYPTPAAAARLSGHLPAEARLAYVDRRQAAALVFYLRRPSILLATVDDAGALVGRSDVYLLVPDAEFRRAREVLGLPVTPVDRVVVRDVVYVLALLRGDDTAAQKLRARWSVNRRATAGEGSPRSLSPLSQ